MSCQFLSTPCLNTASHALCAHASQTCPHAHLKRPLALTHTVVTEAAVGGSGRSEDLAGEAVLELDRLAVDLDLPGPGGRPVARPAGTAGVWEVKGQKVKRRLGDVIHYCVMMI